MKCPHCKKKIKELENLEEELEIVLDGYDKIRQNVDKMFKLMIDDL